MHTLYSGKVAAGAKSVCCTVGAKSIAQHLQRTAGEKGAAGAKLAGRKTRTLKNYTNRENLTNLEIVLEWK